LLTPGASIAVPYTGGPYSVATGDLNGDGVADLVTANWETNNVGVFLGVGNGGYAMPVAYSVGTDPVQVVIGDLNGDGVADLATANSADNTVSVLLGVGGGAFAPSVAYAVGNKPVSVAIGDLDGDGAVDLAIGNANGGAVSILCGVGDGTFASARMVTATTGMYTVYSIFSVAIGDLDGDGIADLAMTNYYDSMLNIMFGNRQRVFVFNMNYALGNKPHSVSIGDLNGDGVLDVAAAYQGHGTVKILLGQGNRAFNPFNVISYNLSAIPVAVAIGDLNGDGLMDLATANTGNNTVNVLVGVGKGLFAGPHVYATGQAPQGFTIGDLNGDGVMDLVTANQVSSSLSIFYGNRVTLAG
jgi:FG-GAP-like repeat